MASLLVILLVMKEMREAQVLMVASWTTLVSYLLFRMSQSGWRGLATRLWTCAPDGNTINLDETDTESLDVETQSEVIFLSTISIFEGKF